MAASESTIVRAIARVPGWLRFLLALAAIGTGAWLLIRPTTSIGALALAIALGLIVVGGLELVLATQRTVWRVVLAVIWVLLGVVLLVLPGLTVRMIAITVGGSLIVRGAIAVFEAACPPAKFTLDGRIASGLLGVATATFGVLALTWPDITLLIAGVVFGVWLISVGAGAVLRMLRKPRLATDSSSQGEMIREPGMLRRWFRTLAAVTAVLVAAGAVLVSVNLHDSSAVTDEFYAAPRDVPDAPGQLIRAETFERDIPANARAWRILYTTTNGDGTAAVASGLVVVPNEGAQHPVIAWNHGTTGFAEICAPSLATQPFESGALFVIQDVIDEGWALVATDYIGLGTKGPHPYLVGEPSARAELDAVRAARQLTGASLGTQTVSWGHSQGGGSSLWVGAIAEGYAPDVPLSGVAALAPASDLIGLVAGLSTTTGGSVFASFVIGGYEGVYKDVSASDYVRVGARVTVAEMAKRCLAKPGILASVLTLLALSEDPDILRADPATGALGQRLRENEPPATISVPLLLGQGESDSLIRLSVQNGYAAKLCAAGVDVDYRTYPGLDHLPLVEAASPAVDDLFAWTRDRFAGARSAASCTP